jgi:SAM-dependent methyltransferase
MSGHSDQAAVRGEPSYVWRSGQERRLMMIARWAKLQDAVMLEAGCGMGMYSSQIRRRYSPHVEAFDVEFERAQVAHQDTPHALVAAAEYLPYAANRFDTILSNEVIEHVADDRETLREIARVLAPGGTCVLYAPNRLYPFETHGIYLGKRYVFGNIPLVNWLPTFLRRRLVPHARAYRHGDWRRLIDGTALRIVDQGYVYPGFDNVAARWPRVARVVRAICYWAEGNPLRRFGLSHLVILRREPAGAPA